MKRDDSHPSTVSPADCQKKENIFLVRGDRYAERPMRTRPAESIRLDEDMARIFAAVRGANGEPPTRGFRRAMYGEAFPWRVLARYVVCAAAADADEESVMAIADRFTAFVREAFRKRRTRCRDNAA